MQQPIRFDVNSIFSTDWKTYLVENHKQKFILPCSDGDVEMPGAWLLVNLIMLMPLIKRNGPILKDQHLYTSGIYGADLHRQIMTRISRTLEQMGYTRVELGHDMIMTVMDMHNLQYTHMGPFVRTMDLFSIIDTVFQDDFESMCTPDYGDIEDLDIKRMETIFKEQSAKVIEKLKSDDLKYNAFRAPLLCGALKIGQFAQFIYSAGPRTDTDDHVFLRPVIGSFVSGMFGPHDLAIESRSAAKASHYNKSQMSTTQYGNRKIHIQNSIIRYLYRTDCGSKTYMSYIPTKKTVRFFRGRYFVAPSGELMELTEDRFDSVTGKQVKFRDPITCKYTDGYCEVCGGTITRSFSPSGNVGYVSNVNTGAPVAQQVLSTKHLISTDVAGYEIPKALEEMLMSVSNDIFLRVDRHKHKGIYALGFMARDVEQLNDLKHIVTEKELHAAYFTDIKFMHVGVLQKDGRIKQYITRTKMSGDSKTYPHLSPEVLEVLRKHPEDMVEQANIKWLLLRNINPELPIMQCTVVNNSIKRFVKRFSDLVTRDLTRYKSANDLMRDLTSLVWSRGLETHVTHMACLIKACLITSKSDFGVPVVEDPDNVMFGPLMKNIPMRSIGGLAAFERYNLVTNSPVTYIVPKEHGILDESMGYTDIIERDAEWPVKTNSPVEYAT